MDAIFGEVRSVTAEEGSFGVESAAGENPAGVGPPRTVVRSVGVAFLIGVLMMDAVSGDPEDGTTLKGEASTHADKVLDPLWGLVAAVGEQAMVGHADADVDGEKVHNGEDGQVLPGEEEESGYGTHVEEAHEDCCDPVDTTFLMLTAHAEVLLDLLGDFGDGRDYSGQLGCGLYRSFFDAGNGGHFFRFPCTFLVLPVRISAADIDANRAGENVV